MAKIIDTASGAYALTFDDVLLQPGASEIMPAQTDITTRIARDIELSLPILSAAMDTVTESRLAIAMAQAGGIGIIHRNLNPEEQAEEVRQVKKFESGMVVNPVVIGPDATLADAKALMRAHRISGIPVVEDAGIGSQRPGRLVGILTNRDVRFADDPGQKVYELMTRENLVTVRENVGQDEAKRLLHTHRIEKLLVIDEKGSASASSPSRTWRSAAQPHAAKDAQGRLRVGAAVSVGADALDRADRLTEAGVDVIVVDTAHGHSRRVLDAVGEVKKRSNAVRIIAGNVATADGARR